VLLCLFLSNRFSYLEIYHHRNKCFLFFFLFSFSPPRSLQVFDNSRENTVDPDSQMEHLAYNMELCRRTAALDPQHRRADKTMLVMHMKDFSIFNQPPMSVTKETVTILGTAFPESLGTCVILDPPPYFKVFWALVSPLIDPKTRSKVYLMSGDLGPGSPNDGLLNELIGPSWQELTGAGGAGVVASAFSPKHKKLVPCSPGFDPLQYWPSVLEREGAFAALVHQQLHEQQQQQQQKLQKLQFSAGGQQQQPQPQQGGSGGGGGGGSPAASSPSRNHPPPPPPPLVVGGRAMVEFDATQFARVRIAHGINHGQGGDFASSTFVADFDFGCLAPGGGKGGNLMGFSADRKYIVKELSKGDHKSLKKVARSYCDHILQDQPSASKTLTSTHKATSATASAASASAAVAAPSLLCLIFAHFQDPTTKRFFLVMGSVLPNLQEVHHGNGSWSGLYDLKGSSDDKTLVLNGAGVKDVHKRVWQPHLWVPVVGKAVFWSSERHAYHEGKRHAADTSFAVTPHQSAALRKAVARDCAWLSSHGLMDYSLLVGTRVLLLHDAVKEGLLLPHSKKEEEGTEPMLGVGAPLACVVVKRKEEQSNDGGAAEGEVDEEPEVHVHYLGVIDFLQPWGATKALAKNVKFLEANKSTIEPKPYAARFARMCVDKFVPFGEVLDADSARKLALEVVRRKKAAEEAMTQNQQQEKKKKKQGRHSKGLAKEIAKLRRQSSASGASGREGGRRAEAAGLRLAQGKGRSGITWSRSFTLARSGSKDPTPSSSSGSGGGGGSGRKKRASDAEAAVFASVCESLELYRALSEEHLQAPAGHTHLPAGGTGPHSLHQGRGQGSSGDEGRALKMLDSAHSRGGGGGGGASAVVCFLSLPAYLWLLNWQPLWAVLHLAATQVLEVAVQNGLVHLHYPSSGADSQAEGAGAVVPSLPVVEGLELTAVVALMLAVAHATTHAAVSPPSPSPSSLSSSSSSSSSSKLAKDVAEVVRQVASFVACAALFTAAVLVLERAQAPSVLPFESGEGDLLAENSHVTAAAAVATAAAASRAEFVRAVVAKARLWSPRFVATNAVGLFVLHRAVFPN